VGERRDAGPYARIGLGIQTKPWHRGPVLSVRARYLLAVIGGFEYASDRRGGELLLGVRY
jgi:hypothetical protein